jgi:hypothetical protein
MASCDESSAVCNGVENAVHGVMQRPLQGRVCRLYQAVLVFLVSLLGPLSYSQFLESSFL